MSSVETHSGAPRERRKVATSERPRKRAQPSAVSACVPKNALLAQVDARRVAQQADDGKVAEVARQHQRRETVLDLALYVRALSQQLAHNGLAAIAVRKIERCGAPPDLLIDIGAAETEKLPHALDVVVPGRVHELRVAVLVALARARLAQHLADAAAREPAADQVGDSAALRHAPYEARLAAHVLQAPAVERKVALLVRHDDARDGEEEASKRVRLQFRVQRARSRRGRKRWGRGARSCG